jgi:hypothetical protein
MGKVEIERGEMGKGGSRGFSVFTGVVELLPSSPLPFSLLAEGESEKGVGPEERFNERGGTAGGGLEEEVFSNSPDSPSPLPEPLKFLTSPKKGLPSLPLSPSPERDEVPFLKKAPLPWGNLVKRLKTFPLSLLLSTLPLLPILFGTGCSHPPENGARPLFIQLKTPKYRLSDAGFLRIEPTQKVLTISTGLTSYRFILKKGVICSVERGRERCIPREEFLKKVGLEEYPPETLDQILAGEPLPFLPTPISTPDPGFVQKSGTQYYKVTPTKIVFKDRKKGIILILHFQSLPFHKNSKKL